MTKCDICKVMRDAESSNEPACCAWYLENVIIGNKKVDDCPVYMEEKHNAEN